LQTFAPTEIFIVPVLRSRDLSPRNCRNSRDPNAAISSVTTHSRIKWNRVSKRHYVWNNTRKYRAI